MSTHALCSHLLRSILALMFSDCFLGSHCWSVESSYVFMFELSCGFVCTLRLLSHVLFLLRDIARQRELEPWFSAANLKLFSAITNRAVLFHGFSLVFRVRA